VTTPWSAEQTQWLQAMGHQVWTLANAGASVMPDAAATEASAMQEAAALLRQAAPGRAEPARPAPTARATSPAPDRLLQAVLRAANRGASDPAVSALVPDPATLRGNAAAKRALWPSLRRLRRPGAT
jgi:hypothetical protein